MEAPLRSQRFEIVRRLGAGGMGEVFEAHDRELDARVALKTLQRHDARGLARFKEEFRALSDLEHPNLISLGGLFHEGGVWFFTMDLVPGVDFLEWVRGDRAATATTMRASASSSLADTVEGRSQPVQFDDERLRSALAQLARGLAHLHAAGKVHRDVKPSNVLVRADGSLVLLDFGLVHEIQESEEWSAQGVVGTVAYMAPEQAAGRPVHAPADWWSVGAMLYEVLTGRLPHEGAPLKVLVDKQRGPPPSPRELEPSVPEDLEDLCMNLLHVDPERRPSGRAIRRRLSRRNVVSVEDASSTTLPSFVGRRQELATLGEALGRAAAGEALTVLVKGPSGFGKTALVKAFTDALRAESSPAVVFSGRCYERESVPFKGLDSVVDSIARHLASTPRAHAAAVVPRRASLLVETFPVLRRVDAFADAPRFHIVDPQERREQMFRAFRELLCRLGDRQPIVLAIDDIQWSDEDSHVLLDELLRPPDGPRALVIATYRISEGSSDGGLDVPGAKLIIDVGGLDETDAVDLAERALAAGRGLAPGSDRRTLAESIAREAGGHPLFIDELARHAALSLGQRVGANRLEDVLRSRISSLDPTSRRVLQVISIASRPLPLSECARSADLELGATLREVSILRAANLARTAGSQGHETAEPFHDRVRDAAIALLSEDAQRSLHRAVARAIEASDRPDPDILVEHWASAGDDERAREYSLRAAEQAESVLAFERAAAHYERARALAPSTVSDEVDARLADALSNAGRGPEAASTLLALAQRSSGSIRHEHLRRAAHELLISGHLDRGLEVLRTVLAEVGLRLPRSRLGAILAAVWQLLKLRVIGIRLRPRDADRVTPRELVIHEVLASLGRGLTMVDHLVGFSFQVREAYLSIRIGDTARIVPALAYLGGYRANSGDHAGALELREKASTLVGEDETARRHLDGLSAMMLYIRGDWSASLPPLRETFEYFRAAAGGTLPANQAVTAIAGAYRHLGRLSELRALLDEWLQSAKRRGDRYIWSTLTLGYGVVRLAYESIDAAEEWAQLGDWTPLHQSFHVQHYYLLRAQVELALARGQSGLLAKHDASLRAMSRALLRRTMVWGIGSVWLEGRMAAADASTGSRDAARRGLRVASQLRDAPIVHGEAIALLVEGGVRQARGERSAERVIRDAIAECDRVGAELYAACARLALSSWVDDESLREDAEAYARREAISNLALLARVFAPGIGRR